MIIKSESIKELAAALSKCQSQLTGAIKDSKNPHFKSSFSSLESVIFACKQPLADNGLSIAQFPETADKGVSVATILMHSSGEYMESSVYFPFVKGTAQEIGSLVSYARRYSYSAVMGIPQVDDDGNAATEASNKFSKELEVCSEERFLKGSAPFKTKVESGQMSTDEVISMLCTKAILTPNQKKEIKSWSQTKES